MRDELNVVSLSALLGESLYLASSSYLPRLAQHDTSRRMCCTPTVANVITIHHPGVHILSGTILGSAHFRETEDTKRDDLFPDGSTSGSESAPHPSRAPEPSSERFPVRNTSNQGAGAAASACP